MNEFKDKYGEEYIGIYKSPYDGRDYVLNELIPKGSISIPDNYETSRAPFVYDQGNSSECAACAYNMIRYLQESDTDNGGSGITEKFSPSFTYGNRISGEDFEGMYLRSVCKKGREGSIPWSQFPGFHTYSKCKMIVNNNKKKWEEMAYPFRISSFYQCITREQVQQAIIESKAVLTGINVLECIYTVDSDGIVYYDPNRDYKSYGGHAIILTGWNTLKDGSIRWIACNSWGEGYGDHGYFYIPENFPWIESPWAILDYNIETKWSEYIMKYNI